LTMLITTTNAETNFEVIVEINKLTVAVGESITASWTITGGTSPYRVHYAGLTLYEENDIVSNFKTDIIGNTTIFTPHFGNRGVFLVGVLDDNDNYTYMEHEFKIIGSPEMMHVRVTMPESVQAGSPITATWTIEGGEGTYSVDNAVWLIYESEELISHSDQTSRFDPMAIEGQINHIPQSGTNGKLSLTISYNLGRTQYIEKDFTIIGSPPPLTYEITLNKKSIAVGQPITATWTIEGGKAPYVVDCFWVVTESNDNTVTYREKGTNEQASFTPLIGVSGRFYICVTDANGAEMRQPSVEFTITGALLAPLEAALTLSSNVVNAGEEVTVSVQASGGQKPYRYRYTWYFSEKNWSEKIKIEETTVSQSSSRQLFGLEGSVRVEVTDVRGAVIYIDANFSILGGQLPSQKVAAIAKECMSSVSGAYARTKWLHDYLIKNAYYDFTLTHFSPYGVLMLGTGVCQSFATGYQMLLNEAGIANKFISGSAKGINGWENHSWNLVKIGGNWYHVDVTFDIGWQYTYFLKSDQYMSADHKWDASKYPICHYDWDQTLEGKAMLGDANSDGTVDIMDLVAIIDFIVSDQSPKSFINADANVDG
ncbi:MAG: hypothetical protein GX042_09065, partial [Bacteroidales bacterium]|nr:hypothetical protein [Bacteroidales bacterium]